MVRFDVVSPFTNVQLHETIQIITDYLYNSNNPNQSMLKMRLLAKLLILYHATQSMFLYKDRLNKQIDGIFVGSFLAPADFFFGNLESKLYSNK